MTAAQTKSKRVEEIEQLLADKDYDTIDSMLEAELDQAREDGFEEGVAQALQHIGDLKTNVENLLGGT